ncbi:NAD(+) diphosphatase [Gammaproteobacteria bacterium]|nr:NAD(+) diphosphatase [Gammaproteobacteria bacterium]
MEPIRQLHDNFKPQSKLIIFCDGKILYDHDQKTYCFDVKDLNSLSDYSPYLSIAKNSISDEYYYSINIDPETNVLGIFMDPAKIEFTDFRTTLSFLDPSDFQLISRASILVNWKATNQFCSFCGKQTVFNTSEGAPDCDCHAPPRYPIISPCIITLIHDNDRILLGRSKFFPPNMFSTLAGFIEAGENAEEALAREVMEEVNVKVSDVRYYGSQSWPFPSQLMLGYFCKYEEGDIQLNDAELEEARWFDLDDLPMIPPDTSISGQLIRSYISGRLKL